jgi:hypothetical protein
MAPKLKAKKSTARPKRDNPEQSKLFIERAREVGADDDESAADMVMGELAKMPPQPKPKSR